MTNNLSGSPIDRAILVKDTDAVAMVCMYVCTLYLDREAFMCVLCISTGKHLCVYLVSRQGSIYACTLYLDREAFMPCFNERGGKSNICILRTQLNSNSNLTGKHKFCALVLRREREGDKRNLCF